MNYGPVRPPSQLGAGSGGGTNVGVLGFVTAGGSGQTGPIPLPAASVTTATMSSATVTATIGSVGMPRVAPNRPVQEDLGTDVIQGVEVHGHRMMTTIPVGQIGNDRPIVSTNESWMAPSLGIVLRSVNESPQSGKQTREVVSLSIGDPDPSVFQPPEGYKVAVVELHEVPCEQQQ